MDKRKNWQVHPPMDLTRTHEGDGCLNRMLGFCWTIHGRRDEGFTVVDQAVIGESIMAALLYFLDGRDEKDTGRSLNTGRRMQYKRKRDMIKPGLQIHKNTTGNS
jgi:hypothetical protein